MNRLTALWLAMWLFSALVCAAIIKYLAVMAGATTPYLPLGWLARITVVSIPCFAITDALRSRIMAGRDWLSMVGAAAVSGLVSATILIAWYLFPLCILPPFRSGP